MAKRRKKRVKKIGEFMPPVEKISRRMIEMSTMVAKKKGRGVIPRKTNLETK